MPKIEVEIDRPWLTLALIVGVLVAVSHLTSGTPTVASVTDGQGGDPVSQVQVAQTVADAEQSIAKDRNEQQVLDRREEILRDQLDALQRQIDEGSDLTSLQQYIDVRDELAQLLLDRKAAEERILLALHDLWDAEGTAYSASRAAHGDEQVTFVWPVRALLGISAQFDDAGYQQKFGMPHHAIDIPTPQGTIIGAAADGVVVKVSDKGMGFNSLVIKHAGGYATLYGHVSSFLVSEGQSVRAGDPVALSGGTPGTAGAGLMTTGPHVHLALYKDGEAVDPMPLMPQN